MNAALADDALVRFAFGRGWATNATTEKNDVLDSPITSDAAPRPERGSLAPIFHYVGARGVLPPNRGRAFFLEEASDQVGFITDAIVSSSQVSAHLSATAAWSSLFGRGYYAPLFPLAFYRDDVLNWDAAIEKAPKRASGTLMVTLQYAGRGAPMPLEDPWT